MTLRSILAGLALLGATPAASEGPALWRVADDDTVIYLFGTFHALPANVDWYRGPVVAAFDQAEELVLESAAPEGAEGADFAQRMMLPEGKSLRARLPEDLRQRFDTAVARGKIPVFMADRLKPWAAAFMIGGIDGGRRGYRGDRGVETVLSARAEAAGKPVGELEGVAGQLAILDGIPSPVQIAFLRDALEGATDEDAIAREDRVLAAWAAGDIASFTEETESWMELPALRTILLDERNANWAAWIERRLERPGTILVAVGSAHLAGEDSVQVHLARRSIDATRVEAVAAKERTRQE